ncbi:hypothetical protein MUK42_12179 [Musa troglodytarum]|uniref:Uncharacterized protein n=1 Tax=Musa troglodytarum TaxID=320322 RepID=A0A9E7I0V0_9LILI|nr:hypothetical protein MUK42_12179 [Musa troglodytarum]
MAYASGLHCTLEVHWLTISSSGRVDVIICGRGGTRTRGPYPSLDSIKRWRKATFCREFAFINVLDALTGFSMLTVILAIFCPSSRSNGCS